MRIARVERRRVPPSSPGLVRLHRLERPEPWPRDLEEAVARAMAACQWNRYPDYGAFRAKLATFLGVDPSGLVIGAGSEELVRSLFVVYGDDAVTYPGESWAMYGIYAEAFGSRPGEGLRFLVNPSQPYEDRGPSLDAIQTAARTSPGVVVVDEAYHGFGAETALPLVSENENLVVLRTFSKAWGAAGLRVGCAIAHPSVAVMLDSVRLSGEISAPSLAGVSVLIDHYESHVKPAMAKIAHGREWLRSAMLADGFAASGYLGNHVLVELDDASGVARRLEGAGYLARVVDDQHLMITCGSAELMRRFYAAWREVHWS